MKIEKTSERGNISEYLIIGKPSNPAWGTDADSWCRVTISETDGAVLGFGGVVWPSAWPNIFTPAGNYARNTNYLTVQGRKLFSQADTSKCATLVTRQDLR